jgi:cytoskeletal protein CcmA (bactofilin family)
MSIFKTSEESQPLFAPGSDLPEQGSDFETGGATTVGPSTAIRGEITGSDSLIISGRIEGAIELPGQRVTVDRSGQVFAGIQAREIVILGNVRGDCVATDRVDIRAGGSLTGDVTTSRISIEDGAHFKGSIDLQKPVPMAPRAIAAAGSSLAEEYDQHAEESIAHGRYVTIREDSEIDTVLSRASAIPFRKVETH